MSRLIKSIVSSARAGRIFAQTVSFCCALILTVFSLFPMLWMLSTALKHESEAFGMLPHWIPVSPTLDNFKSVLTGGSRFFEGSLARYFLNSIVIATGSSVISLMIGILAAFGFSRYRFGGKQVLFLGILLSRLVPTAVLLVPMYVVFSRLHLVNTYQGLILANIVSILPFAIWMLKGYIDTVPDEILDAAEIDGCSTLGTLLRVVVPVIAPAIGATLMFGFTAAWNEFLFALVLSHDVNVQPVTIGLALLRREYMVQWTRLAAATIIAAIPSVAIFTVFQRYLVSGLTAGAVK